MRTKLLSALLLASTALTGVASADPWIRDHRYDRPMVSTVRPAVRYDRYNRDNRDHRYDRVSWSGGVQVTARPSWMSQVNYGFQLDADGDEAMPYTYGNDPYVEGIARGEWFTLNPYIEVAGHYAERTPIGHGVQSIEYQATSGRAYVYTVGVIFADGHQRAFQVNRVLDARHEPNLRIDLGQEGMQGIEAIVFDARGSASIRMLGA